MFVGLSCVLVVLVSCFGWSLSPKDILILINFLFDWLDCWLHWLVAWVGFMFSGFPGGIVVCYSSSRLIICKDWMILVLAS